MLVGEPPQTRLFGTKCPKEIGCVTAAVAAVPYCPVRLLREGKRGGTVKSTAPALGHFVSKQKGEFVFIVQSNDCIPVSLTNFHFLP